MPEGGAGDVPPPRRRWRWVVGGIALVVVIGAVVVVAVTATGGSSATKPSPDVQQLKQNLNALGFATNLTDDNVFDAATQAAVVAFETATGLDGDGVVQLGEVAFAPGPIRLSGSRVDVGGTVTAGSTVI